MLIARVQSGRSARRLFGRGAYLLGALSAGEHPQKRRSDGPSLRSAVSGVSEFKEGSAAADHAGGAADTRRSARGREVTNALSASLPWLLRHWPRTPIRPAGLYSTDRDPRLPPTPAA
jgi:hypothetical protein